jgi:polar amino acid transport system substrate-binding protein
MWRGDGRAGVAFEQMVRDKKIEVSLVNSIEEKLRVLLYGRYDCTVTAKLPFAWYMAKFMKTSEYQSYKKNEVLKQVAIISENEGYLGYTDINSERHFPYKKDFTIKFDIEIFKMKHNGEIKNIVTRFIDP